MKLVFLSRCLLLASLCSATLAAHAQNVGVGTLTPSEKLDVVGGNLKLSTSGSRLIFPDGTTQSTAASGTGFILNGTAPQASSTFNISGNGTIGGNGYLGGSLGVGTASPAGQLANTATNVIATDGNGISQQGLGWVNTSAVGYAGVFFNANNSANGSGLAVKIASASAAALDVSQGTAAGTAGTSLLRVSGSGSVGIGTSTPAAGLHVDRPESGSTTALGVLLSGGSSGNPSLELRGSGKSPYIDFVENTGLDYSIRLLSLAGTLNLSYGGAAASKPANIFVVGGNIQAGAFNVSSDQRFKQKVRPIGSALSSVLALRGVRYEWNILGVQHGGTAGAGQVGLLAQEVEKIYPELVSTDAQGYKAVNYAQLTPVLIEALKEQQAQIEALKARAAQAETKAAIATATFEARLRCLEAGGAQAQR